MSVQATVNAPKNNLPVFQQTNETNKVVYYIAAAACFALIASLVHFTQFFGSNSLFLMRAVSIVAGGGFLIAALHHAMKEKLQKTALFTSLVALGFILAFAACSSALQFNYSQYLTIGLGAASGLSLIGAAALVYQERAQPQTTNTTLDKSETSSEAGSTTNAEDVEEDAKMAAALAAKDFNVAKSLFDKGVYENHLEALYDLREADNNWRDLWKACVLKLDASDTEFTFNQAVKYSLAGRVEALLGEGHLNEEFLKQVQKDSKNLTPLLKKFRENSESPMKGVAALDYCCRQNLHMPALTLVGLRYFCEAAFEKACENPTIWRDHLRFADLKLGKVDHYLERACLGNHQDIAGVLVRKGAYHSALLTKAETDPTFMAHLKDVDGTRKEAMRSDAVSLNLANVKSHLKIG